MFLNMQYLHVFSVVIVISVGSYYKVRLEDKQSEICLVTGPAVDAIRKAEPLTDICDVILTPAASQMCITQNITLEYINIENREGFKVSLQTFQTDCQSVF